MLNRPSTVSLISNPSPTLSTFEWVATNVKSMNRTNKLSSVPFYTPNDKSRRHQFRLVLLRGVIKGDAEEKDPLAVYVEYLPPSPDGNPIEHPGNCKVAVWVLNRFEVEQEELAAQKERLLAKSASSSPSSSGGAAAVADGAALLPFTPTRGAPHRYEETTFTFGASDRMAGFKELVPASDLSDDAMVDPNAFNAMTIRVEITTDVVSVVDVVAKATDRWASSFWGSATSAFAALQTGIDAIKSQVMSTIEERMESGDQHDGAQGQDGSLTSQRTLPWEELPHAWAKGGRSLEEWHTLITATIVMDDGTFLYGADRGLHPDEQVLMTQLGLNHKAIMNASAVFDFDRDVHEGLLTVEAIRKQRYNMVPKVIKDVTFWGNYMWKIAALSTAPRDDQVHLLMSIVNAPPRVEKKVPRSSKVPATVGNVGGDSAASGAHNNAAAGGALAAGDSTSSEDGATVAFVSRCERDVAVACKGALEACEVLHELLADDAEELLITTAVQSCAACEVRLAEVGALLAAPKASAVDALAPLRVAVAEAASQLQRALGAARRAASGDRSPIAPAEDLNSADAGHADEGVTATANARPVIADAAVDTTNTAAAPSHAAVNTSLDVPFASIPESTAALCAVDEAPLPIATVAAEEEAFVEEASAVATAPIVAPVEEEEAVAEAVETPSAPVEETAEVEVAAEDEVQSKDDGFVRVEKEGDYVSEEPMHTAAAAAAEEEMLSPMAKAPMPASSIALSVPATTSAPAAKASPSSALDFLDDEFPEMSPTNTNTNNKGSAAHLVGGGVSKLSVSVASASTASTAKKPIVFEAMPWDDDE